MALVLYQRDTHNNQQRHNLKMSAAMAAGTRIESVTNWRLTDEVSAGIRLL